LAGAPFSFGALGGVQVTDREKATLAEMSIALGGLNVCSATSWLNLTGLG